ncbi:hypothetical protein [Piscinibacter sp.]|uniref:hypothetical protein n=1 Tax=Piscinibacter sp. TaxID=1903157 RepID=UPI002B66EB0D|nr:hypothetical protein [Albitalea sp.]HUG26599.1 hypothetical protein [Albitalea sp.]
MRRSRRSTPSATASALLWLRKKAKRFVHLEKQPRLIVTTRNRSYPGNRYRIDEIGPDARRLT